MFSIGFILEKYVYVNEMFKLKYWKMDKSAPGTQLHLEWVYGYRYSSLLSYDLN